MRRSYQGGFLTKKDTVKKWAHKLGFGEKKIYFVKTTQWIITLLTNKEITKPGCACKIDVEPFIF